MYWSAWNQNAHPKWSFFFVWSKKAWKIDEAPTIVFWPQERKKAPIKRRRHHCFPQQPRQRPKKVTERTNYFSFVHDASADPERWHRQRGGDPGPARRHLQVRADDEGQRHGHLRRHHARQVHQAQDTGEDEHLLEEGWKEETKTVLSMVDLRS